MEKKLRILHIENAKQITGGFNSLLSFCRRYDNWEHIWVLPKNSSTISIAEKEFKYFSLDFIEISKKKSIINYVPRLIKNATRLRKIIKAEQIDILHINDMYNMLGVVIRLWGSRPKVIYHVRLLRTSYMGIMYPVFIKLIKLFADEILCVSEAVRNDVGVSPKAMVVYTDTISEKLPGWEGLKSPESASIIYVANYISGKGHIWAIYAMAEVVKKYPKIRLTFIGSMTEHYQEKYKQSLQIISTNMGLQGNIFFEGPAENVEKRMKDADLVLNLSESESFSMVCLEAISFGVPLISSDCGGPAEIIDFGRVGYLVPNKDPAAAAAAIMEIITFPEKARSKAVEAKCFAKEKFNVQQSIAGLIRAYTI
jgi:glycosyltransferase involved in cell wall biosynthesis